MLQENAVNLKENPRWKSWWRSLRNLLPQREPTSTVYLLSNVPDRQSQQSEQCAVTQAHCVPTHLCLLTVNRLMASSLHLATSHIFLFSKHEKHNHQDSGVNLPTSPTPTAQFMATTWIRAFFIRPQNLLTATPCITSPFQPVTDTMWYPLETDEYDMHVFQ